MKNTGKCPKCEGQRIRYQPGGKLEGQAHMRVGAFFQFLPPIIRIGRYFCLDCGFTEEWVDDMDAIQWM